MSRRKNRFQKFKNVNFQLIEYYSFINSKVLYIYIYVYISNFIDF